MVRGFALLSFEEQLECDVVVEGVIIVTLRGVEGGGGGRVRGCGGHSWDFKSFVVGEKPLCR